MELTDYRDRFPILESTTYLINHSLGAMPAEAARRLARYADEWATRGARAWGEGWWETPVTVGDQVGRIVGAPAGSTVMHQNVTVAEAIVLSCFGFAPPRNRIVFEAGLFPSVRYVQQAMERLGAEVVVCEDADAVADAIDERTLLVPVSHVLYKTGEIQPLERVVARARDAGAYVCLDAYQSAGAVPLDVTALGVEFAVGGSVKWLCGGPGAGWLYVRPDVAERLEPAYAGWQAHARPFAFEPEMEYAEGAARFLTGTPNVPALYAATAGYDLIEEIGVERIRENSVRQTQLLIDLFEEAGFEVGSPHDPSRRGGTVTVRTPEFEAVHTELAERQILCDFRPDAGLRLGPHYYNTDEEVRFAAEQIAEIVTSGAYQRHLGAAARF
ncbi:MAG TPA: aminotransferase class V-fold PLP-dependent enzyme [Gaiellaceae bacterium]